jgi:hypothetical protein
MTTMTSSPPPARNKRCHLSNRHTTINPDSSWFGKDRTADETADDLAATNNAIGTADKPRAATTKFTMAKKEDWSMIGNGQPG